MDAIENQSQQAKGQLILLVEDSATQAARTRMALERAGYEVKVCTTGKGAQEVISRSEPDLVLLDMHLPDVSGRDVVHWLKSDALYSGIPIILLTGVFRDVADVITGLEDGADDYLVKPIEDSELVARVGAALRSRRMQRELARLARMLYTVNQVGQQLATIHNLHDLLISVVQLIRDNFDYPHVHVYLRQGNELVLAAAVGQSAGELLAETPRIDLESNSPAAIAARTDQLQMVTAVDMEREPHPLLPNARSGMASPIHSMVPATGVLEVVSSRDLAFGPHDRLVLQTLADLVGVAVHNSRMYHELKVLATKDTLTGLLNRHSALANLEAELVRSQHQGQALSVVMIDVDAFKQVNDLYGHAAGDVALQSVARLIQNTIRRHDIAGRMGGEEFLIVLPETNQEGALIIAERLRQTCEKTLIEADGHKALRLTMSLGLACWPETSAATANDLVKKADIALYRAKENGRNCVAVYQTSSSLPVSPVVANKERQQLNEK
jgi:two-component system, cell cycle response regulator